MAWVKLSDDFSSHPKVVGLSANAFRALVDSYCYASRHLTDGVIVAAVVKRLASPRVRLELVEAGLWDELAGGIEIHDYLEYNPTADEVREKRDSHAEQMREWRAAKKRKRDASRDASRSPSRDGVVTSARTRTPKDPSPSSSSSREARA